MPRLLPLLLLIACDGDPLPSDIPADLGDDPPCEEQATWHRDLDEDGFGDPEITRRACTQPVGYVDDASDCDDLDDGTYPGAIEVCDGVDRDCDGTIDGPDPVDAKAWHPDRDEDGFGDAETATYACEQPSPDLSLRGDDCDDTDPGIHPGADDPPCDGIDHDCGGVLEVEAAFRGGTPYPTAQAALEAAERTDTVHVCAGTHPIDWTAEGWELSIIGVGETPADVVLTGEGSHRILDLTGEVLTLGDLTLAEGAVDGDGGAARLQGSRVRLERVVVRDSEATGDGGGLWIRVGSNAYEASLTAVDLLDNTAGGDGGGARVILDVNGFVGLDGGTHRGNRAGGDGGAVRVTGTERTANLTVLDVLARDHQAGGDGGWLSLSGPTHAIFRGERLDAEGGTAGDRGGLISVEAPGDGKIGLRSSTLVDGQADQGGVLALQGLGTLDLELSATQVTDGAAREGGLAWTELGGTGHYDWRGADLARGAADLGAALFLTGRSTNFAGTLELSSVTDCTGGPALQVDPDFLTPDNARFDVDTSEIRRNAGGAFDLRREVLLDLDEVELGTGSGGNGPFDVRIGTDTWSWDGTVSIRCEDGSCGEG